MQLNPHEFLTPGVWVQQILSPFRTVWWYLNETGSCLQAMVLSEFSPHSLGFPGMAMVKTTMVLAPTVLAGDLTYWKPADMLHASKGSAQSLQAPISTPMIVAC